MRVHRISAITLKVTNMERSCQFYSKIPGFRIVHGGNSWDAFSTFELGGSEGGGDIKTYLNLELIITAEMMTTGRRRTTTSSMSNSSDNNSKRQYQYGNGNGATGGNDGHQIHECERDDNEKTILSEEKDALLRAGAERETEGEGEQGCGRSDFGRIIFHTENVDGLYQYMRKEEFFSKHATFETEPADAPWGERFFHIREPDGYQLSFAQPFKK